MSGYYARRLSGERLRRCYDLASPRVRRYLDAEVEFVLSRVSPADSVLELGCGYGRVLEPVSCKARWSAGIDTAADSLVLAARHIPDRDRCSLALMDAVALAFRARSFDVVFCIQNGVCAFGVHPEELVREAVRVTQPGGLLLFSSYSERFWNERLEWFRAQAAEGLIGEIDDAQTRDGTIVCKDGFRAGTMSSGSFRALCGALALAGRSIEVDGSSLFLEIRTSTENHPADASGLID